MHERKGRNRCYFLCLLDWRDLLLSKEQIDEVARSLGLPAEPQEPTTGWHVGSCPHISHPAIANGRAGVAHSRIIFEFQLTDTPLENFWQIRRIREELENQVIQLLERKAIPAMQAILRERVQNHPETGGARIFVYPVLEIGAEQPFWKHLEEEKPFNIPTTCFHTRLHDLEGRNEVRMRVSGAKIIATEMSNRFFWELANVVYYQGLYRQSRESPQTFAVNCVHRSLENRLEEFGQTFATTFYELGSARMLERLNFRVLVFTAVLVVFTLIILGVALSTLGLTLGG